MKVRILEAETMNHSPGPKYGIIGTMVTILNCSVRTKVFKALRSKIGLYLFFLGNPEVPGIESFPDGNPLEWV